MVDTVELRYFSKKWFALFPGVTKPISASFLVAHYARRCRQRGPLRAALDALLGTAFHAWIPWRARMIQRKFGYDNDWRRRAVAIAHERFADPGDIALFRIEQADQLDAYVRRFEDAALNKLINLAGWRSDCVLMDKALFYARCAERGLPHPRVAAIVRENRVELFGGAPASDLLVKPARGEGGRGVVALDPGVAVTDFEALTAWLARRLRTRKGTWIVQERVSTHPVLRDVSLNALPTARLTTIVNEGGVPEPVYSVLRLAADPAAFVDNMKAGGILASVDLASGRLGPGCRGYGGGDYATHPATGAPIEGLILPDWEAAKALAVRAHREAFAGYTLIGWDIAFTPAGPVLIEGNGKPSMLLAQRGGRRGLGGQRYGELLAFQLERAASRQDRQGLGAQP